MEITQMRLTYSELSNMLNGVETTSDGEEVKRYRCNKCKDTGWINEHEKVLVDSCGKPYAFYRFADQCECVRLNKAKQKLAQSGIDDAMNFGNFDTRGMSTLIRAKGKAISYADSFELFEKERVNSIMFCGQPGAGKTHLGTSICRQLIDKLGIAVVYMPYRNAVTELKQCIKDEAEYGKRIKLFAQARALYIDDMCKGKTTESDINIMYEIINYRYLHRLPLIISTEKKLAELTEWDEAIGSRIIEMCGENIVTFEGRELNYRLR